ncbi:MAG: DUF2155 domain-containing protein [Magnetococcales bacterium]|nr:hypothetical protein [Magnetococcales bacterium]NGZ28574.1 DUF2155 domain-containing protein [Magnetococcales bacterium]
MVRFVLIVCCGMIASALAGEEKTIIYTPTEPESISRLPLAPHVKLIRARPADEMIKSNQGKKMRFRILDKRTMQTKLMELAVGLPVEGPWGGTLQVAAYVPDLLLQDGKAIHGPEGHVNPAVWVVINDAEGVPLHESWLFARDSAQTAWDHPRFDLSFIGPVQLPPPEVSKPTQTGKGSKKGKGRPPRAEEMVDEAPAND